MNDDDDNDADDADADGGDDAEDDDDDVDDDATFVVIQSVLEQLEKEIWKYIKTIIKNVANDVFDGNT